MGGGYIWRAGCGMWATDGLSIERVAVALASALALALGRGLNLRVLRLHTELAHTFQETGVVHLSVALD